MLEAIHHKFPRLPAADDLQWPLVTSEGNLLPPSGVDTNLAARRRVNIPVDSEDEDDDAMSDLEPSSPLKAYWDSVRARYRSYSFNPTTLSSSQTKKLPSNWTVIHINVTEDKNTLFVSRQEGGPDGDGLVFSVPLRSRRDTGNGDDEEDYLSFDNAIEKLREIVRLSDEGTKAAIHVKPDDDEARAAWWKQRAELDSRLKTLLENIEFCWFGAFKVNFFRSASRLLSHLCDRLFLARNARPVLKISQSCEVALKKCSNEASGFGRKSVQEPIERRLLNHEVNHSAKFNLMTLYFDASRPFPRNVKMKN